ncbi:hypothetical protein ADUPG1_009547 [Aduncisulcus paluster]|uniref:t-SNARE coiled-coil homology domain-containing protein n=1 Tax=Aduncisulcus paluster TaxID=2918883 RepID=A0ABQ5KX51_9EUKA|nr:hypothetical protein ADUPG1_009547 [Aduncisulcus paluster]
MDTLDEIIAFLESVGSHFFKALPSETAAVCSANPREPVDIFLLKKTLVHKIMLNLKKTIREVESIIKDPEQKFKRISSLQMLRRELQLFDRERAELRELYERGKIELQKRVDEDGLDPRDAEDINTERKRSCDFMDKNYAQIQDDFYTLSDTRNFRRFGGRQQLIFSQPKTEKMTPTRRELQTKPSLFSPGQIIDPIPEVDISIPDKDLEKDIDDDPEIRMAIIREQEKDIDCKLDEMHDILLNIKKQARRIHEEMDWQAVMVEEIGQGMEVVADKLDNETKRLKRVVKKLRSGSQVAVDIILIIVLLGVIGTAYWVMKQRVV